ncbi:JmjC domain hydroxylase family protein [Brugia pahangi]
MNITYEPGFTCAEEIRFVKLDSFDFIHFWNKKGELSELDKSLLYKGIRNLDNELIKLVEAKEDDMKIYKVYLKIGHISLLAKDFPRALSAYQKAYNLNKDGFWKVPASYFGLGMVYFHFKAFEIAGEAFNRVLYSHPNHEFTVEIYSRLGFIYKNLEFFELAVKHFTAALNDSRESTFLTKVELRFNIAHCYDIAGDLDRAATEYRTILNDHSVQLTSSLQAQILRQLGWLCYREDCPPIQRPQKIFEAENYLIQSKDLEPTCGKTYYYLGRCYGELQDRAHDAFVYYRHSIDKSEADADTWCSIGVLYQQQSQPMDALQAFICAVQSDRDHSTAWTDLGRLYEVNCQFSDALHCFKKALNCQPAAPEALKARIRVLEKELHPSSLLIGNLRSLPPSELPSLNEAWRLSIPAELSQRQEEFLKQKQQRYRDGSPLLSATLALPQNTNESVELQIKLMNILRSNKAEITERESILLEMLESKYGKINKNDIEQSLETHVEQDFTSNGIKKEIPMDGDAVPSTSSLKIQSAEKGTTDDKKDMVKLTKEVPPLPYSFSLTADVRVPLTIAASELMERCRKRVDKPSEFFEIFDERMKPPILPQVPQTEKFLPEKLLRPTPVILVESRKEAHSIELQNYCYNSAVTLIRGLTQTLKMDLSLFSTKSLLEIAPNHEVEIRSQYRMPPDQNVDHLGQPTWICHSTRSYTTIAHYAQYQAQSFQYSLKEEAEKLRAASAKYGGGGSSGGSGIGGVSTDASNGSLKRRRATLPEESQMPMKLIKFGTNVDLSDEGKFKTQLAELNKMPSFARLVAACNMLTHLGHTVYGMNTVQLYMKVPGARTPGHVENNCLASVNVNIGPGDCEWFCVPYEYWAAVNEMVEKRKLNFLKGSWWPDIDELLETNIPVYRFTQKAGDVVWVGSGCIHWVHSTGWCNNVAWNVGPPTPNQYEMAVHCHEWNKLNGYKSLVPMQHLTWQLARNIRFSNQKMFTLVKQMLIRSLAYSKMIADMVSIYDKPIRMHPRQKGEVSHYCSTCEIEVWNILFVREVNGKFPVYCVQCARKADLSNFTVLQQYTFDDLCSVFDQFRLYPQNRCAVVC